MYINISKVDFGRCYSGGSPGPVEEYYGMYITPADASAINVTPNPNYYTLHGKYLKISTDGKEWFDYGQESRNCQNSRKGCKENADMYRCSKEKGGNNDAK